jgi:hypothetical protein
MITLTSIATYIIFAVVITRFSGCGQRKRVEVLGGQLRLMLDNEVHDEFHDLRLSPNHFLCFHRILRLGLGSKDPHD